jgi:hypothetical protein
LSIIKTELHRYDSGMIEWRQNLDFLVTSVGCMRTASLLNVDVAKHWFTKMSVRDSIMIWERRRLYVPSRPQFTHYSAVPTISRFLMHRQK